MNTALSQFSKMTENLIEEDDDIVIWKSFERKKSQDILSTDHVLYFHALQKTSK